MAGGGKKGAKVLGVIDSRTAERFLLDLANLAVGAEPGEDERARAEYFMAHYWQSGIVRDIGELAMRGHPDADDLEHKKLLAQFSFEGLVQFRRYLRLAWDAPNARIRDWHIFLLRLWAVVLHNKASMAFWGKLADFDQIHSVPPEPTPFEAVLSYFQYVIGDRAVHCKNPACNQQPYFIRPTGKARKYCCAQCAADADRENKKNWWNSTHGKGMLQ